MIDAAKQIVQARWFQRSMIAVILLAGILAGVETNPAMVTAHGSLLRMLDLIVLGIFIIEICLKIIAYGTRPLDFFKDGWNVFDFIVVAICLLPMDSKFAMVLRLGRALRLLRLVSALPKLQLLVGALCKSFSSMGYVSLLMGLMFYMYAIVGVQMFGAHDKLHFGSLSAAFLTLFQTITLDDWKFLLSSASGDSPLFAIIYFVTFILLGTMIMLNLFIGIIMNSMAEMHAEIEEQKQFKQAALTKDPILDSLKGLDNQLTAIKSQILEIHSKLANGKS